MKKIWLVLVLIISSFTSKAGYDLLFCTHADSLDKCKKTGETFDWAGDVTPIELVVMNNDTIGTPKLKFMLFAMKNDREGTLYADLSMHVPPNSLSAVKKLFFYKPGYYKVDVLDEEDKFLATGLVTILDHGE